MSGITVITTDGIRVGYVAGGFFIPMGTSALIPLAPPKPATPRLDAYRLLPVCDGPSWNRSCGHCGSHAVYESFLATEAGPREVIGCRRCGKDSRLG
jgi:hypothetical protein